MKAVSRNRISNCMQPRDKAKLSVLACHPTVTTLSVHVIDAVKNSLHEKKLRDEIGHSTLRDLHRATGFFTRSTCLRYCFRTAGFFPFFQKPLNCREGLVRRRDLKSTPEKNESSCTLTHKPSFVQADDRCRQKARCSAETRYDSDAAVPYGTEMNLDWKAQHDRKKK